MPCGYRIARVFQAFMSIAMTFDDGPNATSTIKLLNLLDEPKVPATFFVLGEMISKNSQVFKKAADVAVGHQFGNIPGHILTS
jgi:peptidoglycan/xylan/chitin deacetylase (PgdA/CDA1 family)